MTRLLAFVELPDVNEHKNHSVIEQEILARLFAAYHFHTVIYVK